MQTKISVLVLFLLLSTTVHAFGVVPSSQDIAYQPGATTTKTIKIINNEATPRHVGLYTEGDLSQLLTLSTNSLDFAAGEQEKTITVTIHHPQHTSIQGKITGGIIIRDLTPGNGQIAAQLSITSKISLDIPYQGLYASTKLYTGDFSTGKGNFVVEVNNQGTADIASAKTLISITKTSGEAVTTLMSDTARIPQQTTYHFTISWNADVPPGTYLATATTTYDGESKQDQKIFVIGAPSVTVNHLDVQDFTLGSIAKLSLYLANEWSESLPAVYAVVKVKQGDHTYASSTTQTISLPGLGTNEVDAYWDTKNVVPGNYELAITLFYNDETQEQTIPITVKESSITQQATGHATTIKSAGIGNPTTLLLALLFLSVLITNILLFRKLLKKK